MMRRIPKSHRWIGPPFLTLGGILAASPAWAYADHDSSFNWPLWHHLGFTSLNIIEIALIIPTFTIWMRILIHRSEQKPSRIAHAIVTTFIICWGCSFWWSATISRYIYRPYGQPYIEYDGYFPHLVIGTVFVISYAIVAAPESLGIQQTPRSRKVAGASLYILVIWWKALLLGVG